MADEGIDIPVNLDIDDAERELLKLQKKIGRTKVSLDVAIGNKEELKRALAENEAAAAAIRAKRDNRTFTGADVQALEELSLQWTQIRKQIVAADAAEKGYTAQIAAAEAEYAKLAQAIESKETETAVSALRDKFHALGEELVKPIQRIQVAADPLLTKMEQVGNGSAFAGLVHTLMSQVPTAFEAARAKASLLADKVKELGQEEYAGKRVAPTSFLDTISNGIDTVNGKLHTLGASISDVLNQAGDGNRFAGVFVMMQTASINATNALKRLASNLNDVTNASGILKSAGSLIGSGFKELAKLPLKGLQAGLKGIASLALRAGSALKSMVGSAVKKGLSSLGKSLKNAAKHLLGLGDSSKKANGGFASGIFTILKYALSIRSLYMLVRKLKAALVDGFKNLAQFSGQTNSDISMVMSALTQLKNSLATAFAPILSVVAPILTTFINMLSSAATAVARLTAALTGKTSFVKATAVQQDYAASLNNTASAAGSAADAAQEASKTLAGFDEINKLDAPSGSSGGGGGGGGAGGGAGDMFTTEQIEPLNFDSWGAAFSAFLDKLLNDGIPMLKNALTSLAGWINDFAANVAEMFTFPGVKDKVVQLGQEVAFAFNDFVNQIDWATIGTALGAGFDLALAFLANLIYSFDFMNLGANLATMFNNAISSVGWAALGQLLWAKFKIALEMLAGFLLNLDMPELAQAAGNVVVGFANAAADTINKIDWGGLVVQVFTFIRNVDWIGLIESLFELVSSGISAGFEIIGALLGELVLSLWDIISSAWDSVKNWWLENVTNSGRSVAEGLLLGIWSVLKSVGAWIRDHIFLPIWNGIKKAFGIASPSKEMRTIGNYISEGLLQGVKDKIYAIVQTFQGLWTSIKNVFANVSGWFEGKFSAAWQAVKDVFSTGGAVFDGIKEGILSGLKTVVNGLISGINRVIAVPFNGLNSALRSIKRVSIAGLRPFSWLPTISVPQIPRLAQGAVIPPNKEFLAVLGDQRNGTNIETPLSTMVQAFKQAMAENGGSGDIYIYLDSDQIAARVEKRQKQKAIRTNGMVKSYA